MNADRQRELDLLVAQTVRVLDVMARRPGLSAIDFLLQCEEGERKGRKAATNAYNARIETMTAKLREFVEAAFTIRGV